MKIGIQTWGSRGDIFPLIALGQGLQAEGHQVTLFYTSFADFDLTNYSAGNMVVKSTKEFSTDSKVYTHVPSKRIFEMSPTEMNDYVLNDLLEPFEDEMYRASEFLCTQNELVIAFSLIYPIVPVAKKYNVPLISVQFDSGFAPRNSGGDLFDETLNRNWLPLINRFMDKHNFETVTDARTQVFTSPIMNLIGCSKIFESNQPLWGDTFQACGFFEINDDIKYSIPQEIETFIYSGDKPVYFSMGSLAFFEGNSSEILDILLESIRISRCRAIIQANWDTINKELPRDLDILPIKNYIPYEYLLPRCLGMVHHGGTGTTHSSLFNGTPSIIVAYAWDQFRWGHELMKLGTCPGFFKRKNVDAIQVAGAIRQLMVEPDFKFKAEEIRRKIKREKGVKNAVKYIHEFISEENARELLFDASRSL